MKEIIECTVSSWGLYWGEGYYQYLLLGAVLYLLVFKRKKQSTRTLVPYFFIALVVFSFPVFAGVIMKCIGKSVYWRILWIFPTGLAIALAGTEFIISQKTRVVRWGLLFLCCMAIAVSGESVWQAGVYEKVNNYQKVPDVVVQICNIIKEDSEEEPVRLAADDFIASYVRVYDPSIRMPYGRAGRGAKTEKALTLYNEMSSFEPDYKKIGLLSRSGKCRYLTVQLSKESQKEILARCGYKEIAMVNAYGVFKFDKTLLKLQDIS